MGAFLCFMGVRLLAMRRVLRQDGSIYLHCDPTASHYLKAVTDAVFGKSNFRNEIAWRRVLGGKNDAGQYGRSSDRILFYTKTNNFYFDHPQLTKSDEHMIKSWFSQKDSIGFFQKRPLVTPGARMGDSGQPWRGINPTGHWIVPNKLIMRYESETDKKLIGTVRERLDKLTDAGYIVGIRSNPALCKE